MFLLKKNWGEIHINNLNAFKTRDTKGTFHANMGTIKERNSMDLTSRKY